MGRRKKGNPVHGWVCLDKPLEMGSTEAVTKVRRLFDAQKAGHAGTLDPLATGILPIALGEATKTVPFMMEAQKVYRFTIQWGVSTDSVDREGEIIARSDVRPSIEAVRAALPARPTRITSRSPSAPARASMCGLWHAIWPWRWELKGTFQRYGASGLGRSRPKTPSRWIS